MVVQLDVLKHIPYFTGLSAEELESIIHYIVERQAERGKIIVMEGEPGLAVYFLISGAIKTFKTSIDGKEQILSLIRPGQSFNEAPVFDNGVNISSAQAMGDVIFYEVSRVNIVAMIRKYPLIALNILKVLSTRIYQLVDLVEDLSFKNVTGRVAKILLHSVSDTSGDKPRLTQQEMASIAGTSREVVGRSLKALVEMGAIKFERHKLIIKDRERLERIIDKS